MTGQSRSRWLFLLFSLVTAGICVRLGFWQLRRLHDRRAVNAQAAAALAEPERTLPGALPPADGMRIVATGSFDLEHQFVLRGRAHDGAPGVEVATPFRPTVGDTAILVIRGFVPSDNATSVDLTAIAEPGTRTIHGVGFALPTLVDSGAPMLRQGAVTWQRLDLDAVRVRLPYSVSAFGVWQTKEPGMTGMPIRIGAPGMSDGPHLNYAIQWFAFAMIFGGGGITYSIRKRDERRENAIPPQG